MADAEGAFPPSKKRVAGREISRDNPGLDDDDEPESEMGTFKRASEEVLATRRIVKVRRQQAHPTSSSNPFAGLQLVAPSNAGQTNASDKAPMETHGDISQENDESCEDAVKKSGTNVDGVEIPVHDNENKTGEGGRTLEVAIEMENDEEAVDVVNEQEGRREETEKEKEQTERNSDRETCAENHEEQTEDKERKELKEEVEKEVIEKTEDQQKDTAEVSGSFSSFQQLSSRKNAFTGLAGTGFSTTSFSFGLISKEGSAFRPGSGFLFGQSSEDLSHASIGIGSSNSGSSLQLFNSTTLEADTGGGGSKPAMQEVPVETGEENERAVFHADAILFEYLDGSWKERGKGDIKLNVTAAGNEKARLVMRARGNYRLILNANLYPDMSLKSMEKRGVTFACINSAIEGKDGFTTFALKFKEASILEDFCCTIDTYKGAKDATQKTSEDSLKTSGD